MRLAGCCESMPVVAEALCCPSGEEVSSALVVVPNVAIAWMSWLSSGAMPRPKRTCSDPGNSSLELT